MRPSKTSVAPVQSTQTTLALTRKIATPESNAREAVAAREAA